jgi:hypothetical protein
MCGGTMQLKRTQGTVRVPGNPKVSTAITIEWICPECDYFEEAEKEGT